MKLTNSQCHWAINAITEKDSDDPVPAYQTTLSLIDFYHVIDRLHEGTEEQRVELRNRIMYNLIKLKKNTPTFMRLRLTTWLYSSTIWKEEKHYIAKGLTP